MKMVSTSIKRVVSTFLLQQKSQSKLMVAVFYRCGTMATFAWHWAAVSGSIEDGETPLQAARREVLEETNLVDIGDEGSTMSTNIFEIQPPGGLYLDVEQSKRRRQNCDEATQTAFGGHVIRVYPFVAMVSPTAVLEMKGTEHDSFQWMSLQELESLSPTVPKLKEAFHHATFGKYLTEVVSPPFDNGFSLAKEIRAFSEDYDNGAACLAKEAVKLAQRYPEHARWIPMLRPSMVPIINAVHHAMAGSDESRQAGSERNKDFAEDSVSQSMRLETERCVQLGIGTLLDLMDQKAAKDDNNKCSLFTIATYSRSSTIRQILDCLQKHQEEKARIKSINIHILCGESSPGDEGELMAQDVGGTCLNDGDLYRRVPEGESIDVVIVGADCIRLPTSTLDKQQSKGVAFVVNKVGTRRLAECARQGSVPIFCCSDRWKLWDDIYPPPLEPIFEVVEAALFTSVLLPPPREEHK
jgi:8-oxo-dGTP pyrophosphatase MutT (NUDIX family)